MLSCWISRTSVFPTNLLQHDRFGWKLPDRLDWCNLSRLSNRAWLMHRCFLDPRRHFRLLFTCQAVIWCAPTCTGRSEIAARRNFRVFGRNAAWPWTSFRCHRVRESITEVITMGGLCGRNNWRRSFVCFDEDHVRPWLLLGSEILFVLIGFVVTCCWINAAFLCQTAKNLILFRCLLKHCGFLHSWLSIT